MAKDLDKQVEKLEEMTDPNAVISVAGYSFTPAKLMIAGSILSAALGGLYGAFEVYKTYEDMKEKISQYEAPDLTEYDKKLELLTEKADKSVQYTQDIKNDLKQDIRRLETIVDSVERGAKQTQRETQQDVNDLRKDMKALDNSVDRKIQKALDNPLAK
jgi:uncharacterized protein YlxW (UPF0749 family)